MGTGAQVRVAGPSRVGLALATGALVALTSGATAFVVLSGTGSVVTPERPLEPLPPAAAPGGPPVVELAPGALGVAPPRPAPPRSRRAASPVRVPLTFPVVLSAQLPGLPLARLLPPLAPPLAPTLAPPVPAAPDPVVPPVRTPRLFDAPAVPASVTEGRVVRSAPAAKANGKAKGKADRKAKGKADRKAKGKAKGKADRTADRSAEASAPRKAHKSPDGSSARSHGKASHHRGHRA